MPSFPETMPKLLSDPLWKDQPFWLLNFFEFKRDDAGGIEEARAAFARYLSSAQRYSQKVLGRDVWFEGARLVSTRCVSAFPESHGVWDAVVLYEYQSPQMLVDAVVGNSDYAEAAQDRFAAEVRTTQVAVKPTWLTTEHGGIEDSVLAQATRYADGFWEESVKDKALQSLDEPQSIMPDPAAIMAQFAPGPEQRIDPERSLLALNLLRYRRNADVPDGRSLYHEYANRIQAAIAEHIPQPRGLRCAVSPCMTLHGDVEWDEFGIMEYPRLAALAGLESLPGASEAMAFRARGLQNQGLVLAEPQLCNGFAEGPFRAATDEDSVALPAPHPVSMAHWSQD
ncbi:MAG: hypothetical protein CBC32_000210 [Proteobacteria bacterium TMED72]|nr:MAG: hypothetical protein CBC32_000210 [Proteobacteria bacterium TMED72]